MVLYRGLLFFSSLAVSSTVVAAAGDGSTRPRGVGPEFAKFYKGDPTFNCISHPAIQISFSSVNDDFCDCPDGSDEPGTSACSHLSWNFPLTVADLPGNSELELTSSLPGFYCKNKGHRPSYIPFQRVNDGVCDYEFCCDGSDEWARVGGIKCEDRCKEIGKEWRKKEETRQKSLTISLKKKRDLLEDANKRQQEVEDQIKRIKAELQVEKLKAKSLEADLESIEKEERSKVVRGKKTGKMTVLAELTKGRIEKLRNALGEVRKERDEVHSRVRELEEILSKFNVEYNPNFNDEGVKRAVRSWEDYVVRGTSDSLHKSNSDRDLDELMKPDGDQTGINWEQWENEDDTRDANSIHKLAAYLPSSLVSFIENTALSLRGFLEDNGILASGNEDSAFKSKAVGEARDAFNTAQKTVEELESRLRDHQSDLETDYGPASIFRALKGVCISKDSGEYTYEHCFLDQTKQIPKKSGSSMRMGGFTRIGTITVDELTETGEIVAEQRTSLEYTNGQTCWNGPARSTTVILVCGEENEILKIAEDEKCVYSMIVTTPAVCPDGGEGGNTAPPVKDEL